MGQAPKGASYNTDGDGWPLIAGAGDFDRKALRPRVKKFTSSPSRLSQDGDIVLGIRASIGEKVWADGEYCLGRGVAGLRSKHGVDQRYLWHWLTAAAPTLAAKGRGATFLQVNREDVASLEIPLPPISEQRRIAAILDAADEVRAKRRESLALADSLTEAIFLDMFGDLGTNSMGWPDGDPFGAIADITSGITKGRKVGGSNLRTVPYLAVSNVQAGHLKLDVVKRIDATEAEIDRWRLEKGDLLLTEGGDPDKLGRGALWDSEMDECIHQNHVFRARITDARYRPLFVSRLLGGSRGRRYFLRAAKQTTGIASINKTQLSAFPMVRPPVELQHDFEAAVAATDTAYAASVAHRSHLDELFASLQQRAFRGEL